MSTVSRAIPGGPPISADSKRVRITLDNGSRLEAIHGELVSKSTNWIICLDILEDTLAIDLLIQQWRRTNDGVGRQYGTFVGSLRVPRYQHRY